MVTLGVTPSSTTLRTSTPSGVPAKPIGGSVNRELVPAQIGPEALGGRGGVGHRAAEERRPPTGDPPAAGPPSPVSSSTALSPMSGALVSGPWPDW